jgi:uncharacterized membrane protein
MKMVKNKFLIFGFSVFLLLLNLNLISAYIDPGTGGYLATSLWSSLSFYAAIVFAALVAFFSRHLINPIKNFYREKKKLFHIILIILIIILVLAVYYLIPKTPKFNESLSGAHIYNSSRIFPGYGLYEGKLIDMNGNLIKKWNSTYIGVIDKNGDYYADKYYDAPIWGRYSWNDSLIWEMNLPIHHEILLTPENTVITFTKETHEYNGRKVEFDVILEFAKNGTLVDRWSTWDNLEYLHQFHKQLELDRPASYKIPDSNKLNNSIWGGDYDYYHLNSIALVPNNSLQGTHPAFNPGNWIISFRHGSMIFILDKNTKQVLWRAIYDQISGNLEGPHTPMMTSNGNIIVMDNGRYRGWSRIISINPATLNITWEYKTENPKDFFSLSQSSVQLLPNYNIFVTEAEKGRVFELTPDKKIVWEFYHPDRQNETNSNAKEKWGQRQEIYRMTKYDKLFIDDLMNKLK